MLLLIIIWLPTKFAIINLLMSISCTSKYKSTPTFTFKSRSKSLLSLNDSTYVPSPQQYNPQKILTKKSKEFKFPKAVRREWEDIKAKKEFPSPGAYQAKDFIGEGPKIKISKRINPKIFMQTPSPDQYNADSLHFKLKQPSYSMRKKINSASNLFSSETIDTPSPGQYEQPVLQYSQSSLMQNWKQCRTIGKSRRFQRDRSAETPGPGCYDAQKSYASSVSSSKKCKLGKQKRKIDFSYREKTPGPGQYNKQSFFDENKNKKRGYSCGSKFDYDNLKLKTPGPGQYENNLQKFKSSPLFKIPLSQRSTFDDQNMRKSSQSPSPNNYQLENVEKFKFRSMSVHKFRKQNTDFLKEILKKQSSNITGPGSYNSNKQIGMKSSPKFMISKSPIKRTFDTKNDIPGPGDYDPKTSLVHQSQFIHKMQTSQRQKILKHLIQNPGPGQYQTNINERLGQKFKFPKQQRNFFVQKLLKQKSRLHQTYEQKEKFPNPPSYMSVRSKINFDKGKLKNI